MAIWCWARTAGRSSSSTTSGPSGRSRTHRTSTTERSTRSRPLLRYPYGALLSWWAGGSESARVEVTNAAGAVVWSDDGSDEESDEGSSEGINRVVWNLRPGEDADESMPRQLAVAPGSYTFTVSIDGESSSAPLEVVGDPRNPISAGDHAAQVAAFQELQGIIKTATDAREALEQADEGVEIILSTLDEEADALREQGEALQTAIQDIMERHFTGPECQGNCRGILTMQMVQAPSGRIGSEPGAPGANTRNMIDQARDAAYLIMSDVNALIDTDVAAYRTALLAAGYTPLGGES